MTDLTESVMGDMLRAVGGDKSAVEALLRESEAAAKEEENRRRKSAVDELKGMFPSLDMEAVIKVLVEYNWDANAAILPLWNLKDQAEKQARYAATRERLAEIFAVSGIEEDEIQRIIEEKDGDLDAVADHVAGILNEREAARLAASDGDAAAAGDEAERGRAHTVRTLGCRFENVTEAEVRSALEKASWDVDSALGELLHLSQQRTVELLRRAFPTIPSADLVEAVVAAEFRQVAAVEALQALVAIQEKAKKSAPSDSPGKGKEKALSAVEEVPEEERETPLLANPGDLRVTVFLDNVKQAVAGREELAAEIADILADVRADKLRASDDIEPEAAAASPPTATAGAGDAEENSKQPDPSPSAESAASGDEDASGGPLSVTISVVPGRVDVGQPFTVQWAAEGDVSSSDWIGMYVDGTDQRDYIKYKRNSSAVKEGSVRFTSVGIGSYRFRYCRGYTVLGESAPVPSGPTFDLEAALSDDGAQFHVVAGQTFGNVYKGAWLGLFQPSADDRHYLTYQYLSSASAGSLTFDVPRSGAWQFRLFTQGYDCVATANVVVAGEDSLKLSIDPETKEVVVECTINTLDTRRDSPWVGVYCTTQLNNNKWRRAKYLYAKSSVVRFKALRTPGEYEARLLGRRQLETLCTSAESVTVLPADV